MLEEVNTKRLAIHTATSGLIVGTVLWVVLLLQGAVALRDANTQRSYKVMFGPLLLMSLEKQVVPHGFTVSFVFEKGLPVYMAIWVIGSMAGGLILGRYQKSPSR